MANAALYLLYAFAVLCLLTAVLPLLRVDWWWVRVLDFPRLQLLVLYVAAAAALAPFWTEDLAAKVLIAGLVIASGWQLCWIYPYLPIAAHETEPARIADLSRRLHLMTANVLQTNRAATRLIGLVSDVRPDVLVVIEVNDWWLKQLAPLAGEFRHAVTHPLENGYGMALFSNLPVTAATVRFLVDPQIPSIDATVRLPSGDTVRLFAVHPAPPAPEQDTDLRDGELILVGREVARHSGPAVVIGDLNDVGWSPTTRLFQGVSRLLDPRKGRGLYATYHARYRALRYPLDHLFHTTNFRLVEMGVLPAVGSDHFPLRVVLSYEPAAQATQAAPTPGEEQRADEAVAKVDHSPGL